MPDLPTLEGPSLDPSSGGPPRHLVILLHGVGADGNDLIGLAPHFAQSLPDALFVSPNAPFAYDMAPFGRQWFSIRDFSPEARLAGALAADAAALAAAIEINESAFKESGALLPTGETWAWAQNATSLNTIYLSQHGVHAYVTGINVDDPANTVRVQVSANLDRLFPSLVPDIVVTESGLAEGRAMR